MSERRARALPRPATSFIGRARELTELTELLGDAGLVTIAGPGGCGKTRLALQFAGQDEDAFDEVWFVELAPIADPHVVRRALATTTNVREEPGRSIVASVGAAIGSRPCLIMLDNCEHVVEAAASIAAELIAACENLRILATSREPLGIAGEHVWRIAPLARPAVHELPAPEMLVKYEAIGLFVERAQTATRDFALTPMNASAVARICARLDGLPLAIELAAARVAVLSVEEIDERLSNRFGLLTTGPRTADPRHQTLRSLIDWSYELLDEAERELLGRLSVFAGAFELAAIEGICTGDGIDVPVILDLLAQLVSKSLVIVDTTGAHARYRLLDTIRAYASEQLTPPADHWRKRHAQWFAGFLERVCPLLLGPDQREGLTRIDEAHDDLRAAMRWSSEHDPVLGLALVHAMFVFWETRGHVSEARASLARALDGVPEPTVARANALNNAAHFAQLQGDIEPARALVAEGLTLAETLDDPGVLAASMVCLGAIAMRIADYPEAAERFERALAIHRETGNQPGVARLLGNLATLRNDQLDYAAAQVLYEESLDAFRRLGDRRGLGLALANHASMCVETGDIERAKRQFNEAIGIFRELGDERNEAYVLFNLANAIHDDDDPLASVARYRTALDLAVRFSIPELIGACIETIGLVCGVVADHERFVILTAAAEATDHRARWRGKEYYATGLNAAVAVLGNPEVDRLRARGLATPLAEALEIIRVIEHAAPSEPSPEGSRDQGTPVFRRESDFWIIAFHGADVRLRHSKGLAYLAVLLARPHIEVHAADLVATVEGTTVAERAPADPAALSIEGSAGEMMDARAREEFKRRVADLTQEVDEATAWGDGARAERARDEIEAITSQLASSYGLGGRARQMADPIERLRKAVRNRIKDAIERIAGQDPELGQHLSNAIKTGTFCSYEPDRSVAWKL